MNWLWWENLFTSSQIQKFFKNYLTLKCSVSNNVNVFSTLPVKCQTLIMFSFLKFLLCLHFVLCSVPWLIPAFQRCSLVSGESSLFYFWLTHVNKKVKKISVERFQSFLSLLRWEVEPLNTCRRHKHFTIIGLKLSISKIQLARIGV